MLGAAFRIRAAADVAAVLHFGRVAAGSAEAVSLVPLDHCPGVAQKGPGFLPEPGADPVQVLELPQVREGYARVGVRGQSHGEQGTELVQPQEDGTYDIGIAEAGMVDRNEDGAERLLPAHETPGPPDWNRACGGIREPSLQPGGVGSPVRRAIQCGSGEAVQRFGHGRCFCFFGCRLASVAPGLDFVARGSGMARRAS